MELHEAPAVYEHVIHYDEEKQTQVEFIYLAVKILNQTPLAMIGTVFGPKHLNK